MAYTPIPVRTINSQTVVPMINAAPQANTTGNITASGQSITASDLNGIGSATVQFSGTFVGLNVTFEATADGTNWFPVNGFNQSTNSVTTNGATGVLTSSTLVVWTVTPLLGQSQMRVRSTAFTSGSMAVVIHPSTQFIPMPVAIQSIAGSVTIGSGTVATTQSTSPWVTREAGATSGSTTTVTPSTTSVTLKASNAGRKALILVNNGTSDCYVSYSATAASTAYTFLLAASQTATIRGEEYSGIVTGIWTATGGNNMMVTETQ